MNGTKEDMPLIDRLNRIDTDFQKIMLGLATTASLYELKQIKKGYEVFALHVRPHIAKYAKNGVKA